MALVNEAAPPPLAPAEQALARAVAGEILGELERRGLAGEQPALLDVAALARLLGESTRTIERWNDAGRIPRPLPLSRVRRWYRLEVEVWLACGAPDRARWEAMKKSGAVKLGHAVGHGLKIAAQK